jgi:hypothetical protein
MSVLVPSQEPLEHRAAREQRFFDLLDWFQAIQFEAWRRVNSYFIDFKPQTIFIVTGQTLTSECSISHKKYGERACEVILESQDALPDVVDPKEIPSYGCTKAIASGGFEGGAPKLQDDPRKYSILLEVFTSSRVMPFEFKKTPTLRARVESHFK